MHPRTQCVHRTRFVSYGALDTFLYYTGASYTQSIPTPAKVSIMIKFCSQAVVASGISNAELAAGHSNYLGGYSPYMRAVAFL